MDLPSGILVKFLKRFSTRKSWASSFWWWIYLLEFWSNVWSDFLPEKSSASSFWWWIYSLWDLPSGLLVEFLKQFFYEKKVAHPVFDDGFTFWSFGQFLKWFSTRKSRASIFALVLWSYLYDTDRLKKGQKITSKEALRTLNDTKNHRFYGNEKKPETHWGGPL